MVTHGRPMREAVLIVEYADGHLEALGSKNVNAKFVRCPVAFNDEMFIMAEDWLEESLTPYWRQLFFPGNVRATANARPLLPTVMARAKQAKNDIAALNRWESA